MADFNFEPPKMQLFGGQNTAWEPLGQEGNLKPYQQQMGYDLYSKVFTDFNADRFRASITSDPARMQQAEQLFNQIDSMQFKSMSPYDGMQRGWTSGNSWAQGAGYDFSQPQLGAGSINPALSGNPNIIAQREAAFQNNANSFGNSAFAGWSNSTPTAPPNWGSHTPYATLGGQRLDVSGMSPEIQQQIFAAMGGSGSNSQSVSDATEALTQISKVLKEDLTPATKEYVEQLKTTASVMNGGRGGVGGFGGGGFNGNDDGMSVDDFGWMHGGVRSEVMDRFGFGKDMPRFNDMDASNPFGEWASRALNPARMAFSLRRSKIAYSMLAEPAFNAADDFRTEMAKQDALMLDNGMIGYDDLMSGEYGRISRRQTNEQERNLAFGRQVDAAYGSWADLAIGKDAARGPLGAAVGIGLPAAGIGLGAASIFGGPVGLAAGAITGIFGVEGYAESAMQNPYEIGRYQTDRNAGRLGSDDFQGAVGQIGLNLRGIVGTANRDNVNVYNNARSFFNNVNAFAAGDMSTGDLKNWAQQNNFNPALAIGQGLNTFLETNTNYGWSRDQQEPVLALDLTYNPQRMPQSNGLFGMQMALGGSQYASWMQKNLPGIGAAMGVSASNQAGMTDLMSMYTSNMYDVQQSGGNVSLYQQSLEGQIAPIGQLNDLRYKAGYGNSVLGLDYYSLQTNDPRLKKDLQGIDVTRFGFEGSNPGFATNVSGPLSDIAEYYSFQGKAALSGRIQNAIPGLESLYNQAATYGADASSMLTNYAQMAALDPQRGLVMAAIGSGDRLALSQNAGMLGDIRYQTMNTQTGMPSMYTDMSRDWYSAMQQDQGGLFRLSYDQASGGTRGMEDRIRNIGRGLDQYQYNQQMASRNIDYQTLTGGSREINAQGFAFGGDGLTNLSSLFQSQGMNLQTGNGMGLWQIQDAQTMLSRQQQQYGSDTQGQRLSLSNQQWNESFALNQQQFNLSTNYQRSEMNIGRSQQQTQESWQGEDLGLSRNRMELQFGWQMQDFDRNIRFARGRERTDLMRQQERATIMHGLDETSQDNQEERFQTEKQWNKEEFDRKKSYFEQSKTLQQEEMNLNKKHHDEMQSLNQQAHDKEKQWMTQEWALQDQQRLLTRQSDELQFKMATDMAIAVKKVTDETNLFKDALTAIDREYTENNAQLTLATTNMSLWTAAVQAFNGVTPGSIFQGGGPATPTPYMSGNHVPGGGAIAKSVGGSTVPSRLSLGDSDSHLALILAALLRIEAMGPGRVNATIYTNDNQVKTSNLYQKSLRHVQ